ncbi:MAG: hypothetical protein LBQ79_12400 [Deltaproteobacteria bacterium]|nr:hypothetical protein [Deltaproteobacteria bacterium]
MITVPKGQATAGQQAPNTVSLEAKPSYIADIQWFIGIIASVIVGCLAIVSTCFGFVLKGMSNKIETGLTGLDVRITGLDDRITGLEARITGLDARITGLETKMDANIARMDANIARLEDKMDTRIARVETEIGKLSEIVTNLRVYIAYALSSVKRRRVSGQTPPPLFPADDTASAENPAQIAPATAEPIKTISE